MSGWKFAELKTLVQAGRGISYGIVQPGKPTVEGVPIVRVADIRDGRIDASSPLTVCPSVEAPYARTRLRGGELLITIVGTIGQMAIVPDAMAGWNVARAVAVVPAQEDVGAYWVKLALSAPVAKQMMQSHLNTTVQPTLNLAVVGKLPVCLPPAPLRERIASILGAYDDLIEVNRRRIALLEEMARRIFEEWFASVLPPSAGDDLLSLDAHGRLPADWQDRALGEVATINGDTISPRTAPARIGYIDIASVSVGEVGKVEWMSFASAPGRARRRVKDGSVIWSMVRPNRKSFALLLDPEPDTVASTGFAVLDAVTLPASYLFHTVTTDAFVAYLTGNATGAAYPAVTGAVFERARILVPPQDLLTLFDSLAAPMLRQVSTLRRTNKNLAAARDHLLPRLISGELPVAAAERVLEDAA